MPYAGWKALIDDGSNPSTRVHRWPHRGYPFANADIESMAFGNADIEPMAFGNADIEPMESRDVVLDRNRRWALQSTCV